nr:uncharacterized protein LOC116430586 isoform X3 [Nomia melanderi]
MAESCESSVSSAVTSVVPHGQAKSADATCQENNTETPGSPAVPDVKCKFIAVPSGDTLIVNFYPVIEDRRTYCISVQTLKYVNPFSSDLSGRYRNLKEISHRFKDCIATPVRLDVSMNAGIMCPGLQGLPLELKFKILRLLNVRDLKQLAQCSSEFYQLCSDPELKEHIE